MTDYIAEPHRECPECGAERERLSRHWTSGPCPHPQVGDATHELLTGLVIGNATAAGNGQHKHVVLATQHRAFAVWTHEQLGWLSHGVREVADDRAGRGMHYRVRTHAHPALDRYRAWYETSEKRVPGSVTLTPRSARAWYACDGALDYHREGNPPRVTFSTAASDARKQEVARLLRGAGYDPSVLDRRVRLSVGESGEWLSWIGEPVPGVEHKWNHS